MKPILLAGNNLNANRGCEAITRGTAEIIRRRLGDDTRFVNACFGDPRLVSVQAKRESDPGIKNIGIERSSLPRRYWFRRINGRLHIKIRENLSRIDPLARDASVALDVGGDNFSLCYGVDVLMKFVHLNERIRRCGTPVVMWGASIGPFSEDKDVETLMAEHMRGLNLILVRETETLAYLASIGVDENVKLVADPAFAMTPVKPELPEDILRFIERRPIGLNLSPMLGGFRADDGPWSGFARECLEALLHAGVGPIVLIPHVTLQGDNDYTFIRDMLSELPANNSDLVLLPGDLSAAEYKWVVSKLRAVVAARTHLTIAGFSSEVPTLSLGYSIKAVGINKDIFGSTDWCIPVADLTPKLLVEKTLTLLKQEDDVLSQMRRSIPVMRERALSAGEHLETLLGARVHR